MDRLFPLGATFALLSVLAFGGGNAILPEMQKLVVADHGWLSAEAFSTLFALAQAAPGPNMMVVPLIGKAIGGWPGLVVASLAFFLPSSALVLLFMRLWQHFRDHPARAVVLRSLAPITAGLVASSAFIMARAADRSPALGMITGAALLAARFSKGHPLAILAGGAIIGLGMGLGTGSWMAWGTSG